jgi:hypothetical protein
MKYMKHLPPGRLAFALTCLLLAACTKNGSNNKGPGGSTYATLSLSQSLVQKGQPLIASLPAGTNAASVRWSVDTKTPTHITVANGQAQIMFSSSGSYRITAAYSGTDSSHSDTAVGTVAVGDTTYTPAPPTDLDTSSLAGDHLTLTPAFDSLGNLIFIAQTRDSYGCAPYLLSLLYEDPGTGGLLTLNFYEVISNSTGNCNGIANPATSFLFTNTAVWPDGTYPIKVNFSTNSFTGSVTIAGGSYSFTWNDSSAVTISPMQLNR